MGICTFCVCPTTSCCQVQTDTSERTSAALAIPFRYMSDSSVLRGLDPVLRPWSVTQLPTACTSRSIDTRVHWRDYWRLTDRSNRHQEYGQSCSDCRHPAPDHSR